ncbi:MAG: hypothetical protein U1F34_01260 [Gammaproteobacteria bacterium]
MRHLICCRRTDGDGTVAMWLTHVSTDPLVPGACTAEWYPRGDDVCGCDGDGRRTLGGFTMLARRHNANGSVGCLTRGVAFTSWFVIMAGGSLDRALCCRCCGRRNERLVGGLYRPALIAAIPNLISASHECGGLRPSGCQRHSFALSKPAVEPSSFYWRKRRFHGAKCSGTAV